MVNPISPSSSSPSSASVDPKSTARSIFRGAFDKDMQNLSVDEQIDASPIVRNLKKRIEDKKKKADKSIEKVGAYGQLKEELTKLRDHLNYLRKPVKKSDNLFERKTTKVTSSEGLGSDFLTVSAKPGAKNSSFNVKVDQIAKRHILSFGQAGLNAAGTTHAIINAAPNTNAAKATIDADGTILKDASGRPTNPFARELYLYLEDSIRSGRSLGDTQAKVTEMFTDMQSNPISDGFDNLTSVAVGPALCIQNGTYKLFSMAGGRIFPNMLSNYLNGAHDVLDAISGVADGATEGDIKLAIGGIVGITYDVGGLPTNNPLARVIAEAAITQQGGTAADILQAATDAATPATITESFLNFFNSYPEDGDYHKNPFALFLVDRVKKAASEAGSDLESIKDAALDAFDEYDEKCTIDLAINDSLQTVLDKINTTSEFSGVQAEAIRTGHGSYVLQISAVNTGLEYAVQILDVMGADNYNSFKGSTITYSSPPQNALVIIDGHFVSSNSNTIKRSEETSIIVHKPNTGVHNQLVEISENKELVFTYVSQLTSYFNELSEFIAQQTERNSDGMFKDTAVLGTDNLMQQIRTALFSFVTRAIPNAPEGFGSLQDIGITLADAPGNMEKNIPPHKILEIDDEKLAVAIDSNFEGVRKIFEFSSTSSSTELKVTSHTGSYYGVPKLKVSVHPLGAEFQPGKRVKIDFLESDGLTVSSSEYYDLGGLPGKYNIDCKDKSSKLYGLSFSYSSAADINDIALELNQGVADQIYGFVYNYTDDTRTAQFGYISDAERRTITDNSRQDVEKLEKKLVETRDRISRDIASKMASSQKAQMDAKIMEAYLDAQNQG